VGTCKNCCRGLCQDSLAEVGDSLACRDRCEDKVARVNAMMAMVQPRAANLNALLIGLVFATTGAILLIATHELFWLFLLAMGAIFLVGACRAFLLRRNAG
jgi:hypothetical protein